MKLTLEGSEPIILALHLNLMRKTLKKGFKKNYGSTEGKKMISLYDIIRERIEADLGSEEIPSYIYELSPEELNMLHSFITWYVNEIQVTVDISTNDQLNVLETISQKLSILNKEYKEEIA